MLRLPLIAFRSSIKIPLRGKKSRFLMKLPETTGGVKPVRHCLRQSRGFAYV